MEVNANIGADA